MSHRGGHSRRGEHDVDRMIDRWRTPPRPVGLTQRMVESTGRVRECDPEPVKASIQVTYTWVDDIIRDAEVVAYTDSAVLVRLQLPGQEAPQQMWLWANAVQRLRPRQRTRPKTPNAQHQDGREA